MAETAKPERDIADELNHPQRSEEFEVVLIKRGKNPSFAETADFNRIRVTARDPLAAQLSAESDAAQKKFGAVVMHVTKPGMMTDPEIMARQREMNGPATDKSKI